MKRITRVVAFTVLIAASVLSAGFAEAAKIGLVIGNDEYPNLGPDKKLQRAVADARAIAQTFRELGYKIVLGENVGRSEFNRLWSTMLGDIQPGDTVVIFYSGHGVEIEGTNYLLPSDVPAVQTGRQELLKREALSLNEFLLDLRTRAPRLSLVILDACRNNPFDTGTGRAVGGARGLGRLDQTPEGAFIIYSAGAGETALDRLPGNDLNPNSVFTRLLIPMIRQKDLALPMLARNVREKVDQMAATAGHRQRPAYYDGVIGNYCLAGCTEEGKGSDASPPVANSMSEAAQTWGRIEHVNDATILEAFRRQFGRDNPLYDRLAALRIEELTKKPSITNDAVKPKPEPVKPDTAKKPSSDTIAEDAEKCRIQRGLDALAACDRVIDGGYATRDQVGSALIARGQQRYELKEYEIAREDFQRAMVVGSTWVQLAYGNGGNTYFARNEIRKAIDHYTRGIEIDPNYASAYTARGLMYERAGDFEKARADYKSALAADAKFTDTQWAHDTATEQLKKIAGKTASLGSPVRKAGVAAMKSTDEEACRVERGPDALAACERIIESKTATREQIGSALISRGQQRYEARDYDIAKEDFAHAVVLNTRWVQLAYGNRGNCYYAKGQYKIAIEHYTRALEIDSNYASAYAARGQLYEKLGETTKARADFHASLKATANFTDTEWAHKSAREGLKRLGE